MKNNINTAIKNFGAWFTLHQDDLDLAFQAFLQPKFTNNDTSNNTGFGTERAFNLYLALSDASSKIKIGDSISNDDNLYKVSRVEVLKLENKPVYYKAIIYHVGKKEA